MDKLINASVIQREGFKSVYKTIEKYQEVFIVNQRKNIILKVVDVNAPSLLLNIIKSLKTIKPELKKKYNINKVGIFGSYARGENKFNSDLDILVDIKFTTFDLMFEIQDLIKKATKLAKVDLLSEQTIDILAYVSLQEELIYV